MKIKVNAELQEIAGPLTVAELLVRNKVEMPDMVSVQLNGQFIKKEEFASQVLKENDEVDFLYFMGGGAIQ
ncbi:MAG: sulfur carrier protein ThiS [Candidatus Margulisiibacteriota bacterium]|jgi:sulfur carrier protein